MSALALESLLPCVVAPLALLALLAFARPATRLEAAALVAAAWAGLAALAGAALWLPYGLWLPALYLLLALLLGARVALRARRAPWLGESAGPRARTLATVVLAGAFLAVAAWTAQGRDAGARPTIALQPPFADGDWLVANGGTTALLNAHVATLDDAKYRPWRGQSYGLDLVRVDALGRRARPLRPAALADWYAYGAAVLAPCDGRVLETLDSVADQPPPTRNRDSLTGNFVLLECGQAWVALAHLRPGSVLVRPNDTVRAGDRLGEVGNSGNSDEPHLHLHAQRRGDVSSAFDAEPLVIVLDGRMPARNALLRAGRGASRP